MHNKIRSKTLKTTFVFRYFKRVCQIENFPAVWLASTYKAALLIIAWFVHPEKLLTGKYSNFNLAKDF